MWNKSPRLSRFEVSMKTWWNMNAGWSVGGSPKPIDWGLFRSETNPLNGVATSRNLPKLCSPPLIKSWQWTFPWNPYGCRFEFFWMRSWIFQQVWWYRRVYLFYPMISAGEVTNTFQAEAKQPMPSGSAGATCIEINGDFTVCGSCSLKV